MYKNMQHSRIKLKRLPHPKIKGFDSLLGRMHYFISIFFALATRQLPRNAKSGERFSVLTVPARPSAYSAMKTVKVKRKRIKCNLPQIKCNSEVTYTSKHIVTY